MYEMKSEYRSSEASAFIRNIRVQTKTEFKPYSTTTRWPKYPGTCSQ